MLLIGSNQFRAGDLVQEILSFQFRACNFVHGIFRAKEISCVNRNLVHGNYVQEILCTEKEISCRDLFFLEIPCMKRNFVQGNYVQGNFVHIKGDFVNGNFVHAISCTGNFVQRKFRA